MKEGEKWKSWTLILLSGVSFLKTISVFTTASDAASIRNAPIGVALIYHSAVVSNNMRNVGNMKQLILTEDEVDTLELLLRRDIGSNWNEDSPILEKILEKLEASSWALIRGYSNPHIAIGQRLVSFIMI